MTTDLVTEIVPRLATLVVDDGGDGVGRLVLHAAEDDALPDVLEQMHRVLDEVEAAGTELRALLVHGATPGPVLPPWSLSGVWGMEDAGAAAALARGGQAALRRLELLPLPTVAAVDGVCLGAALELALACSLRVAADVPRVQLGLPQVRAGLIPALGGTVRLPRLLGTRAALELVLSARPIGARRARRLGLVDELFPARDFHARARAAALARAGRPRAAAPGPGLAARLLAESAAGRAVAARRAARTLLPAVAYAAPAPERALERVVAGWDAPLDEALEAEAAAFGELAAGPRARALAHAADVVRAGGRAAAPGAPVEQAAVLGAGGWGADLAYLVAAAEVPVRLRDRSRARVEQGLNRARRRLAEEIRGGRITEGDADRRDHLLAGGTGWGGFGTVDLVFVVGDGDPEALAATIREVEDHVRDDCLLAVVAPRDPLASAQQAAAQPARVLGVHPVAPLDRYPLLELVAGPRTAPETVAAARRFARRLGHTPLLVGDRPGGVANRLLAAWLAEGARLVEEGAGVEQVERAAQRFGFALGPFRRMDAMGVARAAELLRSLESALGDRFRPAAPVAQMAARGEEFFRYRAGAPTGTNPALPPGFRAEDAALLGTLRDRLLLALTAEAARVLDEEIVAEAWAADLASLLGVGFPRAQGGVLWHADVTGLALLVERLDDHVARFGAHFEPPPLLRRLAAEGATFSGHATGAVL